MHACIHTNKLFQLQFFILNLENSVVTKVGGRTVTGQTGRVAASQFPCADWIGPEVCRQ